MLKKLVIVLALAIVAVAGSGCIVTDPPTRYRHHSNLTN
jgi:hypothetical protein